MNEIQNERVSWREARRLDSLAYVSGPSLHHAQQRRSKQRSAWPATRNVPTSGMMNQAEKGVRFAALHQGAQAFVIPNPWDVGSARLLAGLGFEALATTSSGFANAMGRVDGEMSLAEKLAHCEALSAATDLPLSADLENGFADSADGVAETIRAVARVGVVGGSIEDFDGDEIYPFDRAVERIAAAVEAARALDFPFTLTARAENLLRGRDDLEDTIRRLQAFAEVGADVLYAPGLTTLEQVRLVTEAVSRPVNVLGAMVRGASVSELAAAGAQRISIGGALTRVAFVGAMDAARELREGGSFDWLVRGEAGGEVDALLARGAP